MYFTEWRRMNVNRRSFIIGPLSTDWITMQTSTKHVFFLLFPGCINGGCRECNFVMKNVNEHDINDCISKCICVTTFVFLK